MIRQVFPPLRRRSAGHPAQLTGEPVRSLTDPVALGVHPAAGGGPVPAYVPRDVDAELRKALCTHRFVLVVGESTAGKSRTAYEAMRAALKRHVLLRPARPSAGPELVTAAGGYRRCVVWLDDLERYLGASGLSADLLNRLAGDGPRRVVVLASMDIREHARFSLSGGRDVGGAALDAWRRGRAVVERAHLVVLERRWSDQELIRATAVRGEPRLAQAARQSYRFGVAEVLAGGPGLAVRLRDAWASGRHPRAAALVSAAVDLRRAGLHRPVRADVLAAAHQVYLTDRGGADLRPEPLDAALRFAAAVDGGPSLLRRYGDRYQAHGYLVDASPEQPIPAATWRALVADIGAEEADGIGLAVAQMRELASVAELDRVLRGGSGIDPRVRASLLRTTMSGWAA